MLDFSDPIAVALREDDVWIAEHVFGLKVRFDPGEPRCWSSDTHEPVRWRPNDYIILNDDGTPSNTCYIPGGAGPILVDRYTKDLHANRELEKKCIEKCGQQPFIVCHLTSSETVDGKELWIVCGHKAETFERAVVLFAKHLFSKK